MKKLFAVVVSAAMLVAPLAAQAQERHRTVTTHKTVVVTKTHWTKGHRATAAERRHMAEVRDYRRYRLSAPPRGYHWVRADDKFLLIGITSGVISSVIIGR
jgi:Ni/Co efflux regulator RcnB